MLESKLWHNKSKTKYVAGAKMMAKMVKTYGVKIGCKGGQNL